MCLCTLDMKIYNSDNILIDLPCCRLICSPFPICFNNSWNTCVINSQFYTLVHLSFWCMHISNMDKIPNNPHIAATFILFYLFIWHKVPNSFCNHDLYLGCHYCYQHGFRNLCTLFLGRWLITVTWYLKHSNTYASYRSAAEIKSLWPTD